MGEDGFILLEYGLNVSNDADGLNLDDNQRLDRATEKGGNEETGNEVDTISQL